MAASSAYEEVGTGGRSSEGVSSGQQQCQTSEALAEWRSSEQVENGTPSTSPPYWDCDDDNDAGPKPSELYGKYTWKIDKFSQINKRELRSNAFDVGGYKWYILIYPQGCDVCNHLSLFLCVANHDKLLPGWSHFAQFTIAVVNKDPKKSKYSDTLHRFWKKEHDWGWKKFMELSKVLDGFVDADTLVIKAQVQVIRERADRPFRCLDRQYRRELVRVYLSNVEQICRRFVEERQVKLGKLIEDRARWSSFCAFWLGMDQNSRRRMSKERSDSILKVVVKNFFIEKEVTSTLVMDSLYSGLRSLEGQTGKKGKAKHSNTEEQLVPIVRMEKNMFVLVDDVLLLLESAVLEPLPPKDEKGPQNRTKDGASGDEFNKDSIERDERRLTELGRRTIEIFFLAHIFSKIEVAYQEAVALKRQEELIREEEAAWLAETVQKTKRASGKEKKSKKKQAKQKRNNDKIKDKGRDEKAGAMELYKIDQDGPIGVGNEYMNEETEAVTGKADVLEAVSDVSDSIDCVPEVINPDSEDRDASPANWDTDSSEVHPSTETSFSGLSDLSAVQNGLVGRRSPSVMDDSSSTCSTDSISSVVMNGSYGWTPSNHKAQKSPSRGKNQRSNSTCNAADWGSGTPNQSSDAVSDVGQLSDITCAPPVSDSKSNVLSSSEQQEAKKEVVALQHRKLRKAETERRPSMEKPSLQSPPRSPPKDASSVVQAETERRPSMEKPSLQSPPRSPPKDASSVVQRKTQMKISVKSEPAVVKRESSDSLKLADKATVVVNSPETALMLQADPHRGKDKPLVEPTCITIGKSPSQQVTVSTTTENSRSQQVPAMSRSLCDPSLPGPRPSSPVASVVQTIPSLARSVAAAGRLGPDPSLATHSYPTQSYRNAIMGSTVSGSPASFNHSHSPISAVNSSRSYSQPPPLTSGALSLQQASEITEPSSVRPNFSYGMMNNGSFQNGLQWECLQTDSGRSISQDHPFALNGMRNFDMFKAVNRTHDHLSNSHVCMSSQSVAADEFPHLDIINDLLNDDHGIGRPSIPDSGIRSFGSGSQHLNRGFSFPGDIGTSADIDPLTSSCRFERTHSYHDTFQNNYSGGLYGSASDMLLQQPNQQFVNGHMDGLVPPQWQMMGSDPSFVGMRNNGNTDSNYLYHVPDYSNTVCGVNGYGVYRPSNGL